MTDYEPLPLYDDEPLGCARGVFAALGIVGIILVVVCLLAAILP